MNGQKWVRHQRRSHLLQNYITDCEIHFCEMYQEQELGWSPKSDASGARVLSSCYRTWTDNRLLSTWNQSIWLLHSYYKQCSMVHYAQEWHRTGISYLLLIPDLVCSVSASLTSYSSVDIRSTVMCFVFCNWYGDCLIKENNILGLETRAIFIFQLYSNSVIHLAQSNQPSGSWK